MLKTAKIGDIKFYYREGFSDLKTFDEVIKRDVYQKKRNKITKDQHWMDCGGNVGAFALLAMSKGASVEVYEPDPFNCEMIEKNLRLNGFSAKVHQLALVADDRTSVKMYIGNNNNVWRNSIVKNWNGKGLKVNAINFDKLANPDFCCKMDIEGAEMDILEKTTVSFKRLVYEWSFDIDPSLERFWNIVDHHKKTYNQVMPVGNTGKYETRDYNTWQKSWFPACTNVFCYNEFI
jgi:FkbM family methyltransferase